MNQDWDIRKRSEACTLTQRPFGEGEFFYTALFRDADGFRREDVSEEAWASLPAEPRPFSFWKSKFELPPPTPPEPPFSVRRPFLLLEDEGVTRLTLVRHAQQDYPTGEDFDFTLWEDPPLSGLGRTQAMALSAVLGEQDVDVVACSTMRRAIETAEIVASPHGLTPVVRPELV